MNYIELAGTWYENGAFPKGTKIVFAEEKQAYTVRCANVAFAVCTKPFNARHTVLYSVISWHDKVRGRENLVFGMGAETDEDCQEMLDRLTSGDSDISERHHIPLRIVKITEPKKTSKR